MADLLNKGWFMVPGIRPRGDRTLDEQAIGLAPALAEARGKTVVDLGCAEGLITLEFAKAGASSLLGVELLESHLAVARKVCKAYPTVSFQQAHIGDLARKERESGELRRYDIVLALGIIHKLDDPNIPMQFAADVCADLLLFRAPAKATNGNIKSKFTQNVCNVPKLMKASGFVEEALIPGVRGEAVQYWRRRK